MYDIWKLTTFGTSNFASKFIDIRNVSDIEQFLKSSSKDFFCFWGGSNLLFSKKTYENTFFVRNRLGWIQELSDDRYLISAWESFWFFINRLEQKWVNLLNPMFWLPGTIWWAVIWNAGSYGVEIWNYVKNVTFIDEKFNYIKDFKYEFWYRESNLKNKKILLLEVELQIPQIWDEKIWDKKIYMEKRKQTQEYKNTCWSFFKNPRLKRSETNFEEIFDKLAFEDKTMFESQKENQEIAIPAWWLIEKIWMKGFDYNWVKISQKHANFFVNYDNHDSQKIIKLSDIVKEKVSNKFWIILEEEVQII